MNYPILCRLLGVICLAIAAAFATCAGVSFYYVECGAQGELPALRGFGISTLATVLLACLFLLAGRNASKRLYGKEALATIGLGWIVATILGALPYMLIEDGMRLCDAVFESASGFTTTGSSIFKDVEHLPRSLQFWRMLSHWIGGLGVVVFFVAILSFLGAGAKLLYVRESSAQTTDLGSERIQKGISRIVRLYVLLSILFTLAFKAAGMGLFDAVTHMFSVISTGGFSTYNDSFAHFQSPLIEWLAVVFMAISGTSFVMLLKVRYGDAGALRQNSEVKSYYAILAGAILTCAAVLSLNGFYDNDIHAIFRHSAFQVASVMTTAGFYSQDYDLWPPVLHLTLLVVMIIGGCSGSTSGGVKVLRVLTAWRNCALMLERAYRPNLVRPLRVNGAPISQQDADECNGFLVMFLLISGVSMMLVALMEPGMSFEGIVSSVLASVCNAGPGFVEVGPTRNYAEMSMATKYLLSFLMIVGRVELFAILALFSSRIWKKY